MLLSLRKNCLTSLFKEVRVFKVLGWEKLKFSEVSKRGWRSDGVVAKKSFLCQRLRPLFCTLLPIPLRRRGGHAVEFFWLFLGFFSSPTPSRQPLLETSEKRGLTNQGLKPPTFRENRGKSTLENSGLIGAFPRPTGPLNFWGRSGPIPSHLTATTEEQKLPQNGPFWPNWCLSGQAPVC